jgi:hypothetical protein
MARYGNSPDKIITPVFVNCSLVVVLSTSPQPIEVFTLLDTFAGHSEFAGVQFRVGLPTTAGSTQPVCGFTGAPATGVISG